MADQHAVATAWRRLLLDDKGNPLPDAVIALQDLEHVCGWMRCTLPTDNEGRVDPLATAAALERRGIYAHVKTRLFGPLPPRKEG
jgi:hypothetical protein